MALPVYDMLEKRQRRGSMGDLEDPSSFSWDEDDEEEYLNENDPLQRRRHVSGPLGPPPRRRQQARRPFLRRGESLQDHALRKLDAIKKSKAPPVVVVKKALKTPGRQFLFAALIIVGIGCAIVFGGGYYVYVKTSTYDGYSEPWYPTPKGGSTKTWADSYAKAADMVGRMSLLEKVNVTTGVGWMMGQCLGNTAPASLVGFPALCLQDGPLGIRKADHITATPAGISVGATWNKDLMYKRGKLLGVEYKAKGANVMLGPAVGAIGRFPAGGRNWEGFGSDPVLQGWAGAQTIRGIQGQGVIATIKHFVGNEQEHFRQPYEWGLPVAISANMDDRSLHEIYAWPFADAIKVGVGSVMCSYEQVNNSYACQNSKLLNGILKDEMGFQGFVQSDWGAHHAGVGAALAGLDVTMPGDNLMGDGKSLWGPQLTLAVMNGSLPIDRLDDMVTRVVAAWYQTGQDKWEEQWPNFSSWTHEEMGLIYAGSDDKTMGVVNKFVDAANAGDFSHRAIVRRVAAEAVVLLKNENSFLPLSRHGWSQSKPADRKCRVAVIGEDAVLPDGGPNVCEDRGCNKGTLASGWGSGAVEFPYLVSPLEAIESSFYEKDVELMIHPTNDLPSKKNKQLLAQQDICLVFANADAGEGFIASDGVRGDRNDLDLQKGGAALVQDVAAHCGGPVVVVIHAVGPVILESFIEHPNVVAVIHAHLPGQESGRALMDVLLGDVNPSGKLPYTIGKSMDDYGPNSKIVYYPNGIIPQQTLDGMIDYRWFDSQGIEPRYPFGHGLSYTTFALQDLKITPNTPSGHRPSPLPAKRPSNEAQPPKYNSVLPKPQELLFPSGWKKIHKYIYPYLESVDDIKTGDYPYPDMTPRTLSQAGGGEGGNPALWEVLVTVEATVVNTGDRDGQTVVQLYLEFPEDVREDIGDASPVAPPQERERYTTGFELERDHHEKARRNGDMHEADFADPIYHEGALSELSAVDAEVFRAAVAAANPGAPDTLTRNNNGEKILFPPRQLRAFEKVHTYSSVASSKSRRAFSQVERDAPVVLGDRQTVKFELTRRDLSYWSVRQQNWVIPPLGSFGVQVGFSSRDLKLNGSLW